MIHWILVGCTSVMFYCDWLKCMFLRTNKCTDGEKGGYFL